VSPRTVTALRRRQTAATYTPAEARALADKAMTEADFQRTVIDALKAYGWRFFHDSVAWRSDPGYPDLTCVNTLQRGRTLWVELKTERGKLSAAQESWRDDLLAAGHEWRLVRPSDFDAFLAWIAPRNGE
jgi:hypothetical protein